MHISMDTVQVVISTVSAMGGLLYILWNRLDKKFDKIDERFAKIDEKFDKIDARFDKVDEKFTSIDEKFERKLNSLEERLISHMITMESRLTHRINQLCDTIESVENDTIDLDRRIIVLETINQEHKSPTLPNIPDKAPLPETGRRIRRRGRRSPRKG